MAMNILLSILLVLAVDLLWACAYATYKKLRKKNQETWWFNFKVGALGGLVEFLVNIF